MTLRSDLPVGQTTAWTPLASSLNLASLGLLAWGIVSESHPGAQGGHLAALLLLVGAGACWTAWVLLRLAARGRGVVPVLMAMALLGGALVAFAPLAVVFPAVATLGTVMGWRLRSALAVTTAGLAAMVSAVAAVGHPFGVVLGGTAGCFAGLVVGISRREGMERAAQAGRVAVETERAEVERARAELLADRNHMARELHDVLAHTLAALSLQLEAFDTVLNGDGSVRPEVREQLDKTKRLVREGLDEARGAVRALRDDAPPLDDQLSGLCLEHHADFTMTGTPRALPAQVSLGLFRVTQEALTNVMKHAPMAPTTVHLAFTPTAVMLRVENAAASRAAGPLGTSGGGYGLQGIGERIALLGGHVEAGPSPLGWRVAAEVPSPA